MKIDRYCQVKVIIAFVLLGLLPTPMVADETSLSIKVLNPHRLPDKPILATRTPLGIPNDYKPWITRLDGDKLLIVAFSYGGVPHNKLPKGMPYLERAIFWRSNDSGKT